MKKSIIIIFILLATFILTAFSYINWGKTAKDQKNLRSIETATDDHGFVKPLLKLANSDLIYNIDSRFGHTVTKDDLNNATSIVDLLPAKATESIVTYYSARVSILDDSRETDQRATGNSEILNQAQIKLLQSVDYSANIYIRSDYKQKIGNTSELIDRYLTYFITIIPEKEAEYEGGHESLINYLREGSKEQTEIITKDKLQPGKVNFTVSKEGTIKNVHLTSTSGFTSVDKVLEELITNIPGKWKPATNSKGEKVDQTLVFFFGLEGC